MASFQQFSMLWIVIVLCNLLIVSGYKCSGENQWPKTSKKNPTIRKTMSVFLRPLRGGGINGKSKIFDQFSFDRKYHNTCNENFLLLPFSIRKLRRFNLQVLPNQKICIGGKKLKKKGKNVCMPRNPEMLEVTFKRRKWTLFASRYSLFSDSMNQQQQQHLRIRW